MSNRALNSIGFMRYRSAEFISIESKPDALHVECTFAWFLTYGRSFVSV
jgi:hypothetical protein